MISSLVIKIDPRPGVSASVLAELRSDDRLMVGIPQGAHVPVVLDSPSLHHGRELAEALERLPGVLQVDLVEAHFESGDLEEAGCDSALEVQGA